MESEYDEVKRKLSDIFSWQNDEKRHFLDLPTIIAMQRK